MLEKKQPHVNVAGLSNGMKALLLDTTLTTRMAAAFPELEKIVQQLQRDVMTSERDREDGWAQIVGIDKILKVLQYFQMEGHEDLRREKESTLQEEKGGKA